MSRNQASIYDLSLSFDERPLSKPNSSKSKLYPSSTPSTSDLGILPKYFSKYLVADLGAVTFGNQ